MKQFTFEYENQSQLAINLDRVSKWAHNNNINKLWIQVYVTEETGECIMPIADTLGFCIPDAKFVITHAGMAFASGSNYKESTIVVCNLFEEKDTRIELVQYNFSQDCYDKTVDKIISYVNANPWVKLLSLNTGASIEGVKFLDKLAERIDPEIVISGGAAITKSLSYPAKVVSSAGPLSTSDLIVSFIGGENFHARTDVVVGWKGIGKEFTVTKSEGPVLYELDGKPAFDIYKKYLKIDTKPGMIVNQTIEFPFCYESEGILFLRCPSVLNEDGSIVMMMNDLYVGKKIRLSFGAPDFILEELSNKLNELSGFEPQVISVNSCIGRSFFWGENIVKELEYLQKITLSSGFLTGGEIIRKGSKMHLLNETIVITSMREGDGSGVSSFHEVVKAERDNSLTQRLATFIETVTKDLEEYNEAIKNMAITDGLTGLYNRRELENIIDRVIKEEKKFFLIMIDADNFKQINDKYGHKEGDNVLRLLSDSIRATNEERENEIYAGRWGGDEFLIVFVAEETTVAKEYAESLHNRFYSNTVYEDIERTISVGVAYSGEEKDAEKICINADEKLYEAKSRGKNCIAL